MPSIIEQITAAEQEAQQDKRAAAAKNRERIAAAASEGAAATAKAREDMRAAVLEAEKASEAEGLKLAQSIERSNGEKTDAMIAGAAKRADKAVAYILERVAGK